MQEMSSESTPRAVRDTPGTRPLSVSGILYTIAGSFLFATFGMLFKRLSMISSLQISALRLSLEYITSMPCILWKFNIKEIVPLEKPSMYKLFCFGLLSGLSVISCIEGLHYTSVGVSSTFRYFGYIMSVAIGHFTFGMEINLFDGLLIILAIAGVGCFAIPRNSSEQNDVQAAKIIGWGCLRSFSIGAYIVCRKSAAKEVSSYMFALYASLMGALVFWPLAIGYKLDVMGYHQIAFVALASVLAYIGKVLVVIGSETTSLLSYQLASSTELLFAFTYDIFLFDHKPSYYDVSGAVLIYVSLLGIVYRRSA